MTTASPRRLVIDALTVGVFVLLVFGFCHRPDPTPLPVGLQTKVEEHAIKSAVDSTNIDRLERAAAAARSAQRLDSVRAAALERSVTSEHRRADSLALVADSATTAADSAARFRAAYGARSAEADSLRAENAVKDTAIAQATQRGDSLARAFSISQTGKARADSVIAAAVAVVHASDPPCHFARFFSCASRTAVAIGTVIVVEGVHVALTRKP